MNEVTLRNVRHAKFASRETECFSADVYINGEKAGHVQNDGHGGSNFYTPHSCETVLGQIAKTKPPIIIPLGEGRTSSVDCDPDILIGDLLNDWLNNREDKRITRRQTVFRRKSKTYKAGEWSVIKVPFGENSKALLLKSYGDDLGEILNETVAAREAAKN